MRRVVVTGIGALTAFGQGVDKLWQGLINSRSAIKKVTKFDVSEYTSQIAGEVTHGTAENEFNPDSVLPPKDQRHTDPFAIYGLAAAIEAVEDSGWKPESDEDRYKTGVLFGSGVGGLKTICDNNTNLQASGPRRVSPFLIPSCIINSLSGQIAIKYGLWGPTHACVTACSSGTHAVGDAARLIMFGDADVMVAGSADATVSPLTMAGFVQLRALSTHYNDTPELASRPWDRNRDGFVVGEGAGCLVLEEYEHAKARGAKIYGEIVGYGLSGDGHHVTSPAPDGHGAIYAMTQALKHANLNSEDIDYINAHGTSTSVGDETELLSVKKVFETNKSVAMSSTKSALGHSLGATGSVEAVICMNVLKYGILPPTLNLDDPIDPNFNFVAKTAQERKVSAVMSNSFGFGGTNSCLVFKAI
ncbi:MAG: beta-ketoacyl-ACP synthase II [Alphaproteobacteria bacterium]|nr:beta-ketoacyl-ACP synthase II [Alphaproteobacteria bacterium]